MKRLTGLVLITVLVCSLFMTSCYKKTYEKPNNKKISYTYDKEDNILTIYGKGKMPDYSHYAPPWAKVKNPVHIYIGSGLTSVSDNAFNADVKWLDYGENHYNRIKTVDIDSGVEAIGNYAFKGSSLKRVKMLSGIKKLGKGAFKNCAKLKELFVPFSVNTVSEECFCNCADLTLLHIEKDIKKIGKRAFAGCKKLSDFSIPNTLNEIDQEAFRGCDSIEEFGFSDYVRKIGSKAFYDCKGLKSVYIPKTLTSIGDKAFGYVLVSGKVQKKSGFIVKGIKGTIAEKYAKNNAFIFDAVKTPKIEYNTDSISAVYKQIPYFGFVDTLNAFTKYLENNFTDTDGEKDFNPFNYNYVADNDYDYENDGVIDGYTAKEDETLTNQADYFTATTNMFKKLRAKQRAVGDYIISDFKDGVCINKVKFDKKKYPLENKRDDEDYRTEVIINIPETLDGKKVIKLGEFVKKEADIYGVNERDCEYTSQGFLTEFPDDYRITLKIPKTVKYISGNALESIDEYRDDFFYSKGYITDIEADVNNPYYKSVDGVLYSKDMSWLLFFRPDDNGENGKRQVFTVPKSVKYIADTNICETSTDPYYTIIIGSNVKKIYAHIGYGECGTQNCKFKVAKGSAAEKWLGEEK